MSARARSRRPVPLTRGRVAHEIEGGELTSGELADTVGEPGAVLLPPDAQLVVFSTYTAMWALHAVLLRIGTPQ